MEKEYLKFIDDPQFIEWAFNPTKELNHFWEEYISQNPDQKKIIFQSKELLSFLNTKDSILSPEEKHEVLIQAIDGYLNRNKYRINIPAITRRLLPYAAIAIIFFALGYLLFYQQNSIQQQLLSEHILYTQNAQDTKIILYDGKNIDVKSRESFITITEKGIIVIDNDTIQTLIPQNKEEKLNQIIIPYGKHSKLNLPDGTSVWLNAGSRLLFPNNFNSKKREVFLIGEAYFDVTKSEYKPFVVHTSELMVEVMGTEFNVSAYANDDIIETVLTEGSVKLTRNGAGLFESSILLNPNQMATLNKNSQETIVKEIKSENYTSWKNGFFIFEKEQLSRAIKQIERYYNINFQYSTPDLQTIKINGKLDLQNDRDFIIENIGITASVKIKKLNETNYMIMK